jgi:hypothetical protein
MDAGVTGLALLAFLAAGHTEKTGRHKQTVVKAVTWIIARQDKWGCIGKGSAGGVGYHHAICGLALAEAYGMARVRATGVAAQKAVAYSVEGHQAPGLGWRYNPKQPGDMSVTGWFVQQLASALAAGLRVHDKPLRGAKAFLETCTKQGLEKGRVAYQPERTATPTMTAVGMYCRLLMGGERDDPLLTAGAKFLMEFLPEWGDGGCNFYCCYYGALATFQMGGRYWKAWNANARDMLVEHQRGRGVPELEGSWDPAGFWCDKGGRVYSTAMGALCLETYYRYARGDRRTPRPPPPEPARPGRTQMPGLDEEFFRKLREEADARMGR